MIICTNAAAKIASLLLPVCWTHPDGDIEFSGIPGLRVEKCDERGIVMKHLSTGGILELCESRRLDKWSSRFGLNREVEHHLHGNVRRKFCAASTYRDEGLTEHEEAMADYWADRPGTFLLSALMARNLIFWRHNNHKMTVRTPRRNRSAVRLTWLNGYSVDKIGDLLTSPAIGIRGAVFEPGRSDFLPALLRVDDDQVELDAPFAGHLTRLRRRDREIKGKS
ncbi:hypothetical protein FNH05_04905 [Amycolatopsis rhizosphaerae]|uniref:Uncharacterized protein n=1 Tax=Amycolatopsis rhizosphaerae TaxID=2053003 RepID=A0A558DGH0_9PSEU|nr:hypothetical protein FNH05_04905 [Amycolatopsis rhizosphaerae]